MTNNFLEDFSNAKNERQVEDIYNDIFKSVFKNIIIQNPYDCDGYFKIQSDETVEKDFSVICEYKYDLNFKFSRDRAKALIQVIFYLKRFEDNGNPLPTVIFIGDRNECFALHTNDVIEFLDRKDIDWNTAPSNAAEKYPDFVSDIESNEKTGTLVWNVDKDFNKEELRTQIVNLNSKTKRFIHITEHNIDKVFNRFCKAIIRDSAKISSNDLAGLFYKCICGSKNIYLHPNKKNTLISGSKEFRLTDNKAFDQFFKMIYMPVNSSSQKDYFASVLDRLLEDETRRRKGEFYTPVEFADYGHKFISETIGSDWKNEYVVWDCCCGTKNLTRDYSFKELYCSTLEQSELDVGSKYNRNSVSFRFDFLNDSLEKIPEELMNSLKTNKKILFLINPPYATAGEYGTDRKSKAKVATCTEINRIMKNNKDAGSCSEQLYAQFLYRIMMIKKEFRLTDIKLAFFCNPKYLTGSSFRKFRNLFLNEFSYKGGFLFNSGHFSGVKSSWGISFSVWSSERNTEYTGITEFRHRIIDADEERNIVETGWKTLYNLDGKRNFNDWTKDPVKNLKTCSTINFSSGVKVSDSKDNTHRGTNFEGNLGYYHSHGTTCQCNAQGITLINGAFIEGHGYGINRDNFRDCCSSFAARRLIKQDWLNDKDEYMVPDKTDDRYPEFESDAMVWCLFDSNSQQSSLRGIEWNGKAWDIKNEFFWMSKNEIKSLADENGFDDIYEDCRNTEERYMFKEIENVNLSKEAKDVLDKACEIVRKSFRFRESFNDIHEEYQLTKVWDAGWYQIKNMAEEYLKQDFNEFKELYRKLSEKMRPMVYNLGFLKK